LFAKRLVLFELVIVLVSATGKLCATILLFWSFYICIDCSIFCNCVVFEYVSDCASMLVM